MSNWDDYTGGTTSGLFRDLLDSPATRLAREMAESPATKLAREYADSPAAKLAREMAESPYAKIAPELFDPLDAKLARELARSSLTDLGRDAAFTQLGSIDIAPTSDIAIGAAYRTLADLGRPYDGLSALDDENRKIRESLITSLGGPLGEVTRAAQWASTLGRIDMPDIGTLYPGLSSVAAEATRLHEAAMRSLGEPLGIEQTRIRAMLGLDQQFAANLETTRFKMSVFAGVNDQLGTHSRAWGEAYRSLFGEWRTRPDLPQSYWQDAEIRRRMYEEAEVDPGLADADLKVAVEVVVQSGLVSGLRSEGGAVAVIALGDVSMTIRSKGTENDAFRVIGRFENTLRAFITRKLAAKFGTDWFKQRVNGNIAGDAKRTRKQALARGEDSLPLINYTELGHLASIVSNSRNWGAVFEDVFVNTNDFDHDMQKLIAARRPTAHSRPIDGVRLVELICVVQRLSRQMDNDGAWKVAAESEY